MVDESDSSTELDPSVTKPRLPGCVIHVVHGPATDIDKHVTLRKGVALVGKSPSCRLRLTDKRLSRRHLELRVTQDGVLATDLASTNGTFVDGHRIVSAILAPGARIRIGETLLMLLPLAQGEGLKLYEGERYASLLGKSVAARRMFALLERIESSEATALLHGETGTGKELVARAIHARSPRKDKPFLVLDCAGISPSLANDALFGHARGAFTSADRERAGIFELADGGTVFIDELGELPAELQPRLLRVLETGEVSRLGETAIRKVDVRVIAATHRDLEAAVAGGRFRQDLFYRVAVLEVDVPPLRERREDIPMLAAHFMAQARPDAPPLPALLLERLSAHDWPGNVRELRNAVTRILTLGGAGLPASDEAAAARPRSRDVDAKEPYRESRRRVLDEFERAYLEALMSEHQSNLSRAARAAGLERHVLRDLLRKHGLYARDQA